MCISKKINSNRAFLGSLVWRAKDPLKLMFKFEFKYIKSYVRAHLNLTHFGLVCALPAQLKFIASKLLLVVSTH